MREHVDTIIKWLLEYCDMRSAECKVGDCRTCSACPQLHYVFEQLDKVFTDEAERRLLAAGVLPVRIRFAEDNYRDGTKERCCGTCGFYGSMPRGGFSVGSCLEHEDKGVSYGKVCDKHHA